MRKISSILLVFGILLSMSYSAHAGHTENTRKKCRWYAKKYVAKGHIAVVSSKCGVHYSYAKDNGCTWAQINFTRSWCCTSSAEVYSRSDASGHHGFYHAACGMTGSNPSDLMLLLAGGGDSTGTNATSPSDSIDVVNYVPGTQDISVLPTFGGNNTVSLSNISIKLSSDVNDPNTNIYTLAIWIPQDDTINGVEDTVYTAAKSVKAGTVSLKGGKLTVTGDIFSVKDFSITQNGDITQVNYVGGNKTILIPSDISEDELEVSSIGDIQVGDAIAMFYKAAEANNGILSGDMELNLYPNPAENTLNVSISSQKAGQIDLLLYDINGKLVRESSKHTISQGTNQMSLNIGDLAPGQYFMLAKGEGIKVIKRFTKK